MVTTVVMPQMGYDMQEGILIRWLKQEGEAVTRGEPIAEIETDKAVVEMEAYAAGVLLKVVVAEGATVPVGKAIAFIGEAGEAIPEGEPSLEAPGKTETPEAIAAQQEVARTSEPPVSTDRVRASPLARRLAEEKGIDLARVPGTGPSGRITRDDILTYEARASETLLALPVEARFSREEAPATSVGEFVPLTRMRQAIARRTTQSKREVPHFYVTADVDMTLAMTLRQQLNETLGGESRISVNDLIVKACAVTLVKFPTFNAFFEEDHLRLNSGINVGIAVAVEQGLLIVSLGDCRDKSLVDISKVSKDVVKRAQRGVMREEDYTGSTFSISNMGMFDVDSFSAIIYSPQAAVLAVGTVRKQPVVRDDQITIAQMMKATLSTDHRVADGAQAAQFIGEIKRVLESPVTLLV